MDAVRRVEHRRRKAGTHIAQRAGCGIDLRRYFFQVEDGIRDYKVTGVQTCALPISPRPPKPPPSAICSRSSRRAPMPEANAGAEILNLSLDFPPVPTATWEAAIAKDLKGADYDTKLVWRTEEGLAIRPYYRQEALAG